MMDWAIIIALCFLAALAIGGVGYAIGYRWGYHQGLVSMSKVHWLRETTRGMMTRFEDRGEQ